MVVNIGKNSMGKEAFDLSKKLLLLVTFVSLPSSKKIQKQHWNFFCTGKLMIPMAMFNSYVTNYHRVFGTSDICKEK